VIDELLTVSQLKEVSEGIYSCLDKNSRQSSYDNKVTAYDMLVGNSVYNRLVWGNWPSNYRDFCKQALDSSPEGIYLDAGCGSLVFTASLYAEASNKLIVLLDRSIGMLEQGRNRIKKLKVDVPSNVVFIQGDVFCLPFRDNVFDAIASFGVLHVFDEKLSLLSELERVKCYDGKLFFSSLVGNNAIARKYLEVLKNAGEVATCHSSDSLRDILASTPFKYDISSIGNMAYAKSA
jgi:ubiquinone/menaquinone biosynthesis C-methylase UbiE